MCSTEREGDQDLDMGGGFEQVRPANVFRERYIYRGKKRSDPTKLRKRKKPNRSKRKGEKNIFPDSGSEWHFSR